MFNAYMSSDHFGLLMLKHKRSIFHSQGYFSPLLLSLDAASFSMLYFLLKDLKGRFYCVQNQCTEFL